MKLTFEKDLPHQMAAIEAVVGLFEGRPKTFEGTDFELSDGQMFQNLQAVQQKNELVPDVELQEKHFSIEMETGTGKTYVYLRTIYELHRCYGFSKFVIVVPSVAIREGVLKNLQITHDHFQTIYDYTPVNFQVYDSGNPSALRGFAQATTIEILVINIDSFAKDENVINRRHDLLSGRLPVSFIQSTNPIVIVDEPQNMETEKRRQAIANLNPFCTLRYSATHKNRYHLVYSLNPVKAYELGLVKQIEVYSVLEEDSLNVPFIAVEAVTAAKTKVSARMRIHVNGVSGVCERTVAVRAGDDLFKLSNNREVYQGYSIDELDFVEKSVSFANGLVLRKGESHGSMADEVMKAQIRTTIREHLNKELRLHAKGIKVLSLFFIDKVCNYRCYDEDGNSLPGKIAVWFEEIYTEESRKPRYADLPRFEIGQIHNGYFSQDKKGRLKDTNGETQADDDTYNLIMRDKERLLDNANPLRFIFSHSALREGWDSPNVFQICTLNETRSEIKKRQEIGRGLRLAVDGEGRRIYDSQINRLTVVANEAYEDFARALQQEIEDDFGVSFKNRVKNGRNRTRIKYRKGFELDERFKEIWEKIEQKTTYRVQYDTDELIVAAAEAVRTLPAVTPPAVRVAKGRILMGRTRVEVAVLGEDSPEYNSRIWKIPNVLGYIQQKTELTRGTLYRILLESGRMNDILVNPQLFMELSVQAINRKLHELMINGVEYRRIGDTYNMKLFRSQELEVYLNDYVLKVTAQQKTIYENYMPLDSETEEKFARDCETSENVKFFFKLPSWFAIPTPIGTYNPDWAVIFENDTRVYFIAETKNTGPGLVDIYKLSTSEQQKIHCGRAHCKVCPSLEYKVVKEACELARLGR